MGPTPAHGGKLILEEARGNPCGNRKEVECLGLKTCWEGRVSSASTMDGRSSRCKIFTEE